MLERNGIIYFTKKELACRGSGIVRLAEGFGETLLDLRVALDMPMGLTSACRSTRHNKLIGGAPNSFHICDTDLGCCAVDVRTPNPQYRTKLVKLALETGWSVGVNKTFIHLDRRSDYLEVPQVIFVY